MDIQGAEGEAISGMQRLLSSHPLLFIEFWPQGIREMNSPPENLLCKLRDLGYGLYIIDEQKKDLIELKQNFQTFCETLNFSGVNILAK